MNKQLQHKFYWQQALGAMAIALGAMSIAESPAVANPHDFRGSFEIAQVGVRSQINAPTPLNITPPPGTHIPLPQSNYNNRDYYGAQRGSSRDYIRYEDYRNDRRRENDYRGRNYNYHRDYDTYERNHNRGGTVIIINPATESSYSNNSYIRVIRK
ncbi:hypothetical protein [Pleurocapsa sp. FMAR1]|uniref:hypothetical protein n=1 Tax=Pleurocapsa sp. FMAR1 TaxID=3040204 RepID=UPI0029C83283|nr:hypothetical protein [Pleurocapsa sp. FMAR1]